VRTFWPEGKLASERFAASGKKGSKARIRRIQFERLLFVAKFYADLPRRSN
tara:strand:+ start:1028 stop:1180 length:153 start_codon:yes stop_codon:yes gene_type:complete